MTLGPTGFRDVTGGVYKTRERIHRSVADLRLLAIPTSCRRIAAYNPKGTDFKDWLHLTASLPSVSAIVARV